MEAAAAKDWSDQINTFFEYFFLIHFHNRTKKITQVSQMFSNHSTNQIFGTFNQTPQYFF